MNRSALVWCVLASVSLANGACSSAVGGDAGTVDAASDSDAMSESSDVSPPPDGAVDVPADACGAIGLSCCAGSTCDLGACSTAGTCVCAAQGESCNVFHESRDCCGSLVCCRGSNAQYQCLVAGSLPGC